MATPTPTPDAPVAFITGCSEPSSLGSHLALELKKRGYRVFVSARKFETMAPLVEEGCEALVLDVVDAQSIAAAKKIITEQTAGRLDVLVNNAGVLGRAPLLDTDIDAMRRLFEVNTFAPLAMAQAFAPLLVIGAEKSGKNSVILNVGSASAWGTCWTGAYGASKAALQTISDTLRREAVNLKITTITLELSAVKTAMTDDLKTVSLAKDGSATLYANLDEVIGAANADFAKNVASAERAPAVVTRLADAITSTNPPPKMWGGYQAFSIRWLVPLLPMRIVDGIFSKGGHTGAIKAVKA